MKKILSGLLMVAWILGVGVSAVSLSIFVGTILSMIIIVILPMYHNPPFVSMLLISLYSLPGTMLGLYLFNRWLGTQKDLFEKAK